MRHRPRVRPVPGGYALLAPPMFVKDLSHRRHPRDRSL